MRFDIDVTLSVTHTETFEAENMEEAQKIADKLFNSYGFITDQLLELTTDYDSFDTDHMTFSVEESSISEPNTTLDDFDIASYINE